jgi:hypothetical protein
MDAFVLPITRMRIPKWLCLNSVFSKGERGLPTYMQRPLVGDDGVLETDVVITSMLKEGEFVISGTVNNSMSLWR